MYKAIKHFINVLLLTRKPRGFKTGEPVNLPCKKKKRRALFFIMLVKVLLYTIINFAGNGSKLWLKEVVYFIRVNARNLQNVSFSTENVCVYNL